MIYLVSNSSTYMSSLHYGTNYSKLNIYINRNSLGINGPLNRGERNRKKKGKTGPKNKNVEIMPQNGKHTGTT